MVSQAGKPLAPAKAHRSRSVGAALERLLSFLPDAPASARALLEDEGFARQVEAEARRSGLLPLLAQSLPGASSLTREEELSAQFRFRRLERATAEVSAFLAANGIPTLALKGVALAHRLYPVPWTRPSCDVDLLVRPRDLDNAREALVDRGWKLTVGPPVAGFELRHHLNFEGPGRLSLELHFTPACGFQSQFPIDALFERASQIALADGSVGVLGEADNLVHIAAHAVHHGFSGFKWLFDIKLACRSRSLDWGAVVDCAREARVASAVGMALREARRRMDAPVPDEALESLGPGRARVCLVRGLQRLPRQAVGVYPLSLALADRLSAAWLREAALRPVERVLRLLGHKLS